MLIVAVDPGGTTGVARIDTERPDSFASFEQPPLEAIQTVELLLPGMSLLVIEDFRISGQTVKKTRQYDALWSIGALRYLAWRQGVDVDMRLPSEREFATNARLKEVGWRNPSKGGHRDDAARHLFVTLIRRGDIDAARFLEEA